MIDKVRLKKFVELDEAVLRQHHWRRYPMVDKQTYAITGYCYKYFRRGISFRYIVDRATLRVEGRFINFSKVANRVFNLDELYAGQLNLWFTEVNHDEDYIVYERDADGNIYEYIEDYYPDITAHGYAQDLDDVLNELSALLSEVTGVPQDIRTFRIEKIEVCMNLYTPNVNQYIMLMNMISEGNTDPRYTNHVLEQRLMPYTSCYIKTKGEYEKKSKQNYTVNFYNKLDQLRYLRGKGKRVTDHDLELAENVLRMEVQVNYYCLKRVFEKNGLDFTTRSFFNLINIDLCAEIIKDKYTYFLDKQTYLGFYSYQAAKERVQNSNLTTVVKNNLKGHLLKCSRNPKLSFAPKASLRRKQLAALRIHHCLIPTAWGIDHLPSPMNLLDQRVTEIKQRREEYQHKEDPYDFLGYYKYQLKQLKKL